MIAKDVLAVAFVVVVSTALSVPVALGADEYNTSTGTTVAGQGVALRGADVVSLASTLKVEPGHAKFTAVHDGVGYSQGNMRNRRCSWSAGRTYPSAQSLMRSPYPSLTRSTVPSLSRSRMA